MAGERVLSTGRPAKRLGISIRTIYRSAGGRATGADRAPAERAAPVLVAGYGCPAARSGGKERCGVYARVSSEKQAEAGNLQPKKDRLVAAATDRGYEVTAAVAERASGLNEKCRDLYRLFRMAADGEIDGVLRVQGPPGPLRVRVCRGGILGPRRSGCWRVLWRWTRPRSWWPLCGPS